jgi:putative component of membrane protein insertase Oxa1/YidC/SpoIIIJ protein YidD
MTTLSYLSVARAFHTFLVEQGMPTVVTSITREHVEMFLVSLFDRGIAPATVAESYRSFPLCSASTISAMASWAALVGCQASSASPRTARCGGGPRSPVQV